MISGLREAFIIAPPPRRLLIAAVAIVVRGQSALNAMPADLYSPDMPSTHMLMPNFAIVYATCGANQRCSMLSGGDRIRTCGFAAFLRCGIASLLQRKVPRVLIGRNYVRLDVDANDFVKIVAREIPGRSN